MKFQMNLSRQAGASMVEVLVGLAIGLVILTAIGTAYVSSNDIVRQREDQTLLNEPARIVMRMLRQNLGQAGFVDVFDRNPAAARQGAALFTPGNEALTNIYIRDPAVAPVVAPIAQTFAGLTPLFGCDGAMNSTPDAIVTAGPPLVQNCGAANPTQHSLRIAYQGVSITPAPGNTENSIGPVNVNTGEGLDCLQQAPQAGIPPASGTMVINQYFLRNFNGVSQLSCSGSGANQTQDIAQGVEEFILRYQMAAAGNAANPIAAGGGQAQYLNATQVTASPLGWAGVTAVEVCLISATDPTRGAAAKGTVELQTTRPTCQRDADGVYLPNIVRVAGDTRLWKRFTAVMAVRNAVFASPM